MNQFETAQERAARYERALQAIANISTFSSIGSICSEVLQGYEAECPFCGTDTHAGPCDQQEKDSFEKEKRAARDLRHAAANASIQRRT